MPEKSLHVWLDRASSVAAFSLCLFLTLVSSRQIWADDNADHVRQLDSPELNESSGLAFSHRERQYIWTHNDSGGEGILYAFDSQTGRRVGICRLPGPQPIDWEDMVSFRLDGKPVLLVADCGDNQGRRLSIALSLFAEPPPDRDTTLGADEIKRIQVRYPDQPQDCEAVWYDPANRQVLLLGKRGLPFVNLYAVSIDEFEQHAAAERSRQTTARLITRIALPAATGADRDPQTGNVWIVTYWQAWCYRRGDAKNLVEQLATPPTAIPIPRWRQIEAIAIDSQSRAWVSSEGSPALLGRLRTIAKNAQPD